MTAIREPTFVIDQVADEIDESLLYVRPRASELHNLGILKKGAKKISPTCGRNAHIYEPSDDLVRRIERDNPETAQFVERCVRSFIVGRVLEARKAKKLARTGPV